MVVYGIAECRAVGQRNIAPDGRGGLMLRGLFRAVAAGGSGRKQDGKNKNAEKKVGLLVHQLLVNSLQDRFLPAVSEMCCAVRPGTRIQPTKYRTAAAGIFLRCASPGPGW